MRPPDYLGRRGAEKLLALFVPQNIFAVLVFDGKRERQVINNRLQEVARFDNFFFLQFLFRNILRQGEHHIRVAVFIIHRHLN